MFKINPHTKMRCLPKIFFGICGIFIVICGIFVIFFISNEMNERSFKKKLIQESNNDPFVKKILLYAVPKWMRGKTIYKLSPGCIATADKNYLPKIELFDVVLFHGEYEWIAETTIPKIRSANQFYVFVNMECPLNTLHTFAMDPKKEIYNLTMSYRRDSDVYWPYGFISDQKISYQSTAEEPSWMEPIFEEDPELLHKIKMKNKTAAWFVSNCKPKSNRDQLVKAIQNTIDVDIYGACGPLKCPRSESTKCFELLEENYYFYLSFENSICNDYITEKVFNIMRYNVVPVVYGGANYTQHLPPHSYINVNDFATASDLANYLKNLTKDPNEYVKYFWWKKYYTTIEGFTSKAYENLCHKLHELTSLDGKPLKHSSYENIWDWWVKDQCTDSSKIKFS